MASLRRIPGSRFWIACITRADGRRTNLSTKTSDRKMAKTVADRLQEVEHLARSGKLVEDQVKKLFNEVLDRVGLEQMSSVTVREFLADWLAGKQNPSTAERYSHTVELFLDVLKKKADGPLNAISHKDILVFMEDRKAKGAASKTISVDAKTLNTAFNLARKLGHIQSNPVEKALALRPIEVQSSKKECFTQSQVESLLQSTTGDWRTMVMLGYYTGARIGDCANLEWANVDLTAGVIAYTPQKTRKRNKQVVVPIHPELQTHLERIASKDVPEVHLCPSLAGKGTGGKFGLSASFKSIMEKAGVDCKIADGQGKRKFSQLSFHSLRHSFNSALANQGIDQETRMRLTGHSSVDVNTGYTHLELTKLKAAVEKLPFLHSKAEAAGSKE
jgi:integrase